MSEPLVLGEAVADATREPPVVEAIDLVRRYRLGGPDGAVVEALRGISLRIDPGEFVTIVGPSGSGKSTLLHLLGALDRPTSGTLRFSGRDVAEMSDADLAALRNREIGFVFQQFHLLARTSALANVELPLVYRDLPRSERRRRAAAALESVGLADRLGHRPSQLSGGEQQRVAIARALANQPALLLADEPTGNLDHHTAEEVFALLERLVHEMRLGALIATHNLELARRMDRMVTIEDGVLVELS